MSLAIAWNDLTNTTWRFQDPYGNRINGIGTWTTDRTLKCPRFDAAPV